MPCKAKRLHNSGIACAKLTVSSNPNRGFSCVCVCLIYAPPRGLGRAPRVCGVFVVVFFGNHRFPTLHSHAARRVTSLYMYCEIAMLVWALHLILRQYNMIFQVSLLTRFAVHPTCGPAHLWALQSCRAVRVCNLLLCSSAIIHSNPSHLTTDLRLDIFRQTKSIYGNIFKHSRKHKNTGT